VILGRLGQHHGRVQAQPAQTVGDALARHQPVRALEFTAHCGTRDDEQIANNS